MRFAFWPNILVHLEKGNLEITLMFEMETKFNYIVLLPERHVVRLVSTQTFVVPGQSGADSGSGSVLFQTESCCRGSFSVCDFVILQLFKEA